VTDSALGPRFTGRYRDLFEPFLTTAFPRLLMEIGILGLLLVATIHIRILDDGRRAGRLPGRRCCMASHSDGPEWSWVMAVAIFYKDIVPITSLSYIFWYGSGLVVSARLPTVRPGEDQ